MAKNEELIKLILDNYNLSISKIELVKKGKANCYKLTMLEGTIYFLKEVENSFKKEDIIKEAELIEFLHENNFPAIKFIKTKENEYTCSINDRCVFLQKFIEGIYYDINEIPDKLLMLSAELLGKMHSLFKEYKFIKRKWSHELSVEKLKVYDFTKNMLVLENLSMQIDKLDFSPAFIIQIREDLKFLLYLKDTVKKYISYFKYVTLGISHGDYCCPQFICNDDEIKAIVDFTTFDYLPVTWELMHNYVLSADEFNTQGCIDISKMITYVKIYMLNLNFNITYNDLKFMPYIFLFQIFIRACSTYEKVILRNQSWIKWAFTLTAIARYFDINAKRISDDLCDIFYNKNLY